MNIVFMGSSNFGVPALKGLISAGYNIAGVVTQADTRQGRGMKAVGHTAVKEAGLELKLRLFQPRNVNSLESIQELKELEPDLLVVIAYGQILSQEILDIPRIMPLNIHASLLPALRGPAPINWAIINGDKITGNTLMKISLKMDSGPVIAQSRVAIGEFDSAITLEEKLSLDAADLLLKGLEMIKGRQYQLQEQDPAKVTIAPKLNSDTCRIDWSMPATRINDQIRGLLNWSAAFTSYKGKRLNIHSAGVISTQDIQVKPGLVVSAGAKGIEVATGLGHLLISQLQPEGKRVMSSGEFIAGYKIVPNQEVFFGQ